MTHRPQKAGIPVKDSMATTEIHAAEEAHVGNVTRSQQGAQSGLGQVK